MTKCAYILLLAALVGILSDRAAADEPATEKRHALSAADVDVRQRVAALIAELSNASFDRRTEATRRLCEIGPLAGPQLIETASGQDAEASLRAKYVLRLFDDLWFAGTDITLSFSKPKIAWNEAVDLTVTVANRAPYETRIPFEQPPSDPTELRTDARQVGAMMDVADWLIVRGPDGRRVELRVDDISAAEDVFAAVERRIHDVATMRLKSQQSVTVTIPAFNRGWARYPLLDLGRYEVTFEYAPAWKQDPTLVAWQVGRVTSNVAHLEITRAAPDAVSRRDDVAIIELDERDGRIIATLVNRTDQTLVVNRNFGSSPPFATVTWVCRSGQSSQRLPASTRKRESWRDFREADLVNVEPGQGVELAGVMVDDLLVRMKENGVENLADGTTVQLTYANACDRKWQALQRGSLAAVGTGHTVLERPLPLRLRSLHIVSHTIALKAKP